MADQNAIQTPQAASAGPPGEILSAGLVRLDAVSKSYDHFQALHPTSLSIEEHRRYALIGPSGCGKSTCLRLIIGLIKPDSGQVLFHGHPLDESNIRQVRQRMGYMIQDGGLFPHLTARGNTTLMARQLNWEQTKIDARLRELTDLTHFPASGLERFPAELSGGQRQRVALMRALMLDPEVLLLDEPLTALDPLIRRELQIELKSIFDTLRKTVVLVTHDLIEAEYFADGLVLMRQGRIEQQADFRSLVEKPASEFVAEFVHMLEGPGLLEQKEQTP